MTAISITLAGIARLARIVADPACDTIDGQAAGHAVLIDLGYWAGKPVPQRILAKLAGLSAEARALVDWEPEEEPDEDDE